MSPMGVWTPTKPAMLAGYLEALSRPVFSTGISWKVVDAKWDGIRAAFEGFDPRRVAALTPDDVDRLTQDTRVIRNRKKIEATIRNAEMLIALDHEYGSFEKYLDSYGTFEETVAALRHDFGFIGESGAYLFLWAVARPVPSHDEWAETHGRCTA